MSYTLGQVRAFLAAGARAEARTELRWLRLMTLASRGAARALEHTQRDLERAARG